MRRLFSSSWIFFILLAYGTSGGYLSLMDLKWDEPVNIAELNTPGNEFAPCWNHNEGLLYYNSDKEGSSLFFTSKYIGNISFDQPRLLGGGLNQPGNNQSYISFIDEDEALLSTFYLFEKRSYLNIFNTTKKKMAWTQPVVLDSLLSECFNSHPTVSPDGTYMIFSTNRNSENGDTDLWQAVRQSNGGWGSLMPIDELNSPGNEITPCLSSPDTLYFATDGQEGPGGFDIFISIRYDGIWQTPVPLSGINSQFNESDPAIIPGNILIFASDRPGGRGGLDLYASKAKLPEQQKTEFVEEEVFIETFISSLNVKKYENVTLSQFPFSLPLTLTKVKDGGDYQLTGSSVLNFDSLYKSTWNRILTRMAELPDSKLILGPCDTIASLLRKGVLDVNSADPSSIPDKEPIEMSGIMNQTDSSGVYKRIWLIDTANINDNSCIASDSPELLAPIKLGEARYEIEPPFLEFILNSGQNISAEGYECRLSLNGKVLWKTNKLKFPDTLRIDLTNYTDQIFSSDSLIIDVLKGGDSPVISKSLKLSITKNNFEDFKIYQVGEKKFERYLLFVPDISLLNLRQYYGSILEMVIGRLSYAKSVTINYFSDNEQSRSIASKIAEMIKSGNQKTQKPINQSYIKKSELLTFSESSRPFLYQILLEK
jgi:hypothetical protein